jgi:phosphoribosylglycinamide formyltransferase 1
MSRSVGLGIMASGNGSNARSILNACADGKLNAHGSLIISNNEDAGVHSIAKEFGIPSLTIQRDKFENGSDFANKLIKEFRDAGSDLICLAGYMRKIPTALIKAYPEAVINIHPALLPLHGGKGMYGIRVHEDVIKCNDTESGATVHYVDAEYDRGPILLQRCGVEVALCDTPESLAKKVLKVEHALYPNAIAKWIELLQ